VKAVRTGLAAVWAAEFPTDTDQDLVALIHQFYARESQLLDEGRENEWFDLLDEQILYTVPIRQSTEPRSAEINRAAFRLRDTYMHIRTRIDRLNTGMAYSEVPPSRTMRLVSSIVITGHPEPNVVEASSALLVYRQRGIDPYFDLIPCRRNDRLRLSGDGVRLLAREVILTETSLATPNLSVFL
jgi:3-phenylpropionate/cinnamic acid dioxygenase small subunit